MELLDKVLEEENLKRAKDKVIANKGASGIDGIGVEEVSEYLKENQDRLITIIGPSMGKQL